MNPLQKIKMAFIKYDSALNADRYRITAIDALDKKKGFVVGKYETGSNAGFYREELLNKRLYEAYRLQKQNRNIYYTPISHNKHHLLIDDLSKNSLTRLIEDGYKPAVIIESSPHNYQAIITIAKLRNEHDRYIANRLTERLNKQYGDQNLLGAIHPHRSPGFNNLKPKYQKQDGSFPEVQLLKYANRECKKTYQLSQEIEQEYLLKLADQSNQEKLLLANIKIEQAEPACYFSHYKQLINQYENPDLSRIDSMIALRLRLTGHSQRAIEALIRHCAPIIRKDKKSHDWEQYSKNTASFAFSLQANIQTQQYHATKIDELLLIEGRPTIIEVLSKKYMHKKIFHASQKGTYKGMIIEKTEFGFLQEINNNTLILHKDHEKLCLGEKVNIVYESMKQISIDLIN